MRFVIAATEEGAVMSRVCEGFGISRTIGYKWLQRYMTDGVDGLKDQSRAPHAHGRARSEDVVSTALALRDRYRHWGPRKLRVKLAELRPDIVLPGVSTIGDWLRQEGLTEPRRRRRHCPPFSQPLQAADRPNSVWSVDFKGWFRTGDGIRCDPLTISDAMSRYLLCCQAVDRPDHVEVRRAFDAVFCEFGLPTAIRSDNGPPFASTGAGGLSALSLWWIKLEITPERIEPGKPQQNGRHERMHRTLKAETANPPASSRAAQQARFECFRQTFNLERPHEALQMRTPASVYRSSLRPYPCPLREPAYGAECAVRRVRSNGEIRWGGELIFVSEVLVGEPVAVEETEAGDWRVRFGDLELGFIDLKRQRLMRKAVPPATKEARGFVDNACALPTTPPAPPQPPTRT
jgi:transposase InsO family protein